MYRECFCSFLGLLHVQFVSGFAVNYSFSKLLLIQLFQSSVHERLTFVLTMGSLQGGKGEYKVTESRLCFGCPLIPITDHGYRFVV